jgi:hypothetical protein
MAKHKVAELEGALLDAAVAKAEGFSARIEADECVVTVVGMLESWRAVTPVVTYRPSTDWLIGGQIIDREKISVVYCEPGSPSGPKWDAYVGCLTPRRFDDELPGGKGPAALIAAMRAYVAGKFGEEVELPC